MAAITFGDELVRDYLLYRGFLGALKIFDAELKSDKDRGFRADRIVEHLTSCISSLDLGALREAWNHLDHRVFYRLEHSFLASAKKLETALLRMYVVTCITSGRQDKLRDFFEKMTPELQGQPEWKDWFALLFLKSPEDNPTFQAYFTRQWQDTMLVSLQNFLSVVFQSMMPPTLLSYEEELLRMSQLQEENEMLRQKLEGMEKQECHKSVDNAFNIQEIPASTELMDDFYVIAQEAPAESQTKSIKSLIRNISSGLPASPILGRRNQSQSELRRQVTTEETTGGHIPKLKQRSPSVPNQQSPSSGMSAKKKPQLEQDVKRKVQSQVSENVKSESPPSPLEQRHRRRSLPHTLPEILTEGTSQKGNFIVLSQEEFKDHHNCITHCKFNASGSIVASADMDGVIKIWNPSPSPHTLTTIVSKSSVLALEWASKRERLLMHGNLAGRIRIYDIKERRNICDISSESNNLLKDQKIICLVCSPTESSFISSTSPTHPNINKAETISSSRKGQLLLWDMRTMQLEHSLLKENNSTAVSCCAFNHNGQLLVTGTTDGKICMFDLRACECIACWPAHTTDVFSLQFSTDETACYTMAGDGKFVQWSINKTGEKMAELSIHNGATGPFTVPGNAFLYYPVGKLFTFDPDGSHALTCGPAGGIIYKSDGNSKMAPLISLGGHKWPVATVDWCTGMDCGTCLTGSVDGNILISTLLPQ